MAAAAQVALRTCPRCGVTDTQDLIVEAAYHCRRCAFELAHLEIGVSGGIRRVVGWLRAPGDLVGERYRVTTVLGKGGYAATYLVSDMRLTGKRRALKEIPEHLYDEHETELLSRLRHRGIPDISDRFRAGGMVYLVLEFGGTQTLESERRRCGGRVPIDRVASWMRQLCDVLAYLHAQRPPVVHRDLKPANVLLDECDHVMLIDFGIAKELAGIDATRTLARAASHGFSPPEQVLGTGTDPRSDVYALAATVYALLTGRVPPPAHERLLGSPLIPPRRLECTISPELDDVILRALDLRPELRPHSVDELRAAFAREQRTTEPARAATLDDALTVPVALARTADAPTRPTLGAPTTARSPGRPAQAPPRTASARALAAAAAVGLLVVGVGVAVLLRPVQPASPRPLPNTVPATTMTTVAAAPTTTVTSPPLPSTTAAPPPPLRPETLEPRIRALLSGDEFAGVTIAVDDDRIRLGRLPGEAAAQRARDVILASLPGLELPIDVELLPPPAPPAPSPAPVDPTPPSPPQRRADRARTRAAARAAKLAPRRPRSAHRASPPANWVLIPQPARRTD
jgi:hypothetical protein